MQRHKLRPRPLILKIGEPDATSKLVGESPSPCALYRAMTLVFSTRRTVDRKLLLTENTHLDSSY